MILPRRRSASRSRRAHARHARPGPRVAANDKSGSGPLESDSPASGDLLHRRNDAPEVKTGTPGPWTRYYEQGYRQIEAQRFDEMTFEQFAEAVGQDWRKKEMAERLRFFQFGRLCAYLRNRCQPTANIGGSILVYRLSAGDLGGEPWSAGRTAGNDETPYLHRTNGGG